MEAERRPGRVRFGTFELDLDTGELRRAGVPVHLAAQPTALLVFLAEHADRLVTREELGRSLWGDRWRGFEQGLNSCVSQVRSALGDHADSPTFIETVPRRGYRFIAPVEWLDAAGSAHRTAGTAWGSDARTAATRAETAAPGVTRVRLAWPIAIAAGLLMLAVVAVTRAGEPTGDDARVMLAVVPFDNLHADPASTYLGAGLAEELITRLANVAPDRLGVIARTSSQRFGNDATLAEIGDALGVDYVVAGSIRSGDDRFRITARLFRVSDQAPLWSQSWDRGAGADLLDLEYDVARRVTGALSLALLAADTARLALSEDDSPARLRTLEARFLLNRNQPGDLARAIELFEAAVAADSVYAPAWTGLARWLVRNGPSRDPARARSAAERAVRLDDAEVESHLLLAGMLYLGDWDWDGAAAEYGRALALAPGRADVHHQRAWFLASVGRIDEAMAAINEAMRLDPVSTLVVGDGAFVHYFARDYDGAIELAQRLLRLDPESVVGYSMLLHIYTAVGRTDDALAAGASLSRLANATPEDPAAADQPPPTRIGDFWSSWVRWWRTNTVEPTTGYQVALGFAALGQPDSALVALQRAYSAKLGGLSTIAAEPAFDPLRADPRFEAILDGMGLTDMLARATSDRTPEADAHRMP